MSALDIALALVGFALGANTVMLIRARRRLRKWQALVPTDTKEPR